MHADAQVLDGYHLIPATVLFLRTLSSYHPFCKFSLVPIDCQETEICDISFWGLYEESKFVRISSEFFL